jgi:UDP-N-acetylmuramate--alanine ligase
MAKYYFIGIKGSGMSSLATILHDLGHEVRGSDVDEEIFTEHKLKERGIEILSFDTHTMQKDEIIIAGNAFNDQFSEVVEARELGCEFYRYHEKLGEMSKNFISVGVSGTHGKTTTTSMVSNVFKDQKETAYLIGDGTGFADLNSEYFIFEACEYRRHFLSYYPKYSIVTNVEYDHVDYYKTFEDYKSAFKELLDQTTGYVVACYDDEETHYLKDAKTIFYGTKEGSDVIASNVVNSPLGHEFDVYIKGEFYSHFVLPMYGHHNLLNALATITVSYLEGLDPKEVEKSLTSFSGAKRRFVEYEKDGQIVVDDYAHHPTEIAVTVDAARQKYPDRTVVAIFQPHTYSRVKAFLTEFADALNKADYAYVLEIFGSVREPVGDITIEAVREQLHHGYLLTSDNLSDLKQYKDAVLLFMGSEGEIYTLVKQYLED